MAKTVSFENRDKFVQLGIAISALRRFRGMTQQDLAERIGVSRDTIRNIENPNVIRSFSADTFLKITYALDVKADVLLNASVFPDKILSNKK
ncbi:MAG: helix-turn-helix transcriptional regulator [Clostridia bacterium]|nr:helix-turn-helix transcriptional regulator [Clostridia bacterium]